MSETAAGSSGKSPEEIAFELVNKLKGQGVWGERNISEILDMYAECLDAAKGMRAYEGQKRVIAPVRNPGDTPEAPVAAAPQETAPIPPAQAAAQVQAQPVHVQQQTLQQVVDSVYNQS